MIEVYITDIQNIEQARTISTAIREKFAGVRVNVDLNDTHLSFPCGHTILRIHSDQIDSEKVVGLMKNHGFSCEILEDKICM